MSHTSGVICKFVIQRVSLEAVTIYQPGENGKLDYQKPSKTVLGAKVSLTAVQSAPFGQATPYGQVDMFIAEPEAAKIFIDALKARVDTGDIKQSEFEVVFKRP